MGWIADRHMRQGGSIGPGGLKAHKKGAPLRRVVRTIVPSESIFQPEQVVLACGHEAESWGGVSARCVACKTTTDEKGRTTMSTVPKLSDNMRTALLALVEGRSAERALPGRGRNVHGTLVSLGKRDLLKYGRVGGTMGWEVTDAGRALVASWRCAACGHVAYHCPASGCNHHDEATAESGNDSGWCECEEFVAPSPTGSNAEDVKR